MLKIWKKASKFQHSKFSVLHVKHDSKNIIILDFNPQQPRSLIHILGLQYFYLGSILLEPFDSSIDVNRYVVAFKRFGGKKCTT